MPDVRPLRPGDPERIGDYRLVGVLGSGGQGVVYRAVAGSGREVAIKLLHSQLSHDDDVRRGFLREVEAAQRVAAFCTASVLDVGVLDEQPYIVSEFVPGVTLQELVRASGPRTGGGLDRLAISTLTALTAIHQAGIVHRDFKPANVLMGPEGPIVIDFGIAKALDGTTRASGPVGTPAYMSPEQIRGEAVLPASDVFSWAGTMVFAATGHPPFTGETIPAVLNGVLNGTADLAGLPPHLADPIRACLTKDPATRPTPLALLQWLTGRAAPVPKASPGATPLAEAVPEAAPVSEGRAASLPMAAFRAVPETAPVPASAPATGAGGGGGAATVPSASRSVSRRVLIGGVAAAAAAAVSAVALIRSGGGQHTPASPSTSPIAADTDRPVTPTPTSSPGTTVGGLPLGTPIGEPVSLDGTPVALAATGSAVVCGLAKGPALVWDTATATAPHRLGGSGTKTTSVAYGTVGGKAAVATGHPDGTVRLWTPAGKADGTDQPWTSTGEPSAEHRLRDPVLAMAIGSAPVAITEKYDSMADLTSSVRFWNITTGKQIGSTITSHFQGVHGVAFGRLGDDDVAVTGDGHNQVRVWHLATGQQLRAFGTGEVGGIERLAWGRVKGRPVVVSTHLDATLRVYDLSTGRRGGKWTFSRRSPDDRGTAALVAGELDGVPIAATAHSPDSGDSFLRVWNLSDGKTVGRLNVEPIRALALTRIDGRPVVVAATDDYLRVWSLGTA